jgi:hypothetical protein
MSIVIPQIKPNVARDWGYAESKMDQVKKILRQNISDIVRIEVATPDEDMKESTDLKITVSTEDIAVRVRRWCSKCSYRDLTIRSFRRGGTKTELAKLREGYGDLYLYAWEDQKGALADWILVDINKMRKTGLLYEDKSTTFNIDGTTGFVAYSITELDKIGALIAKSTSLSERLV